MSYGWFPKLNARGDVVSWGAPTPNDRRVVCRGQFVLTADGGFLRGFGPTWIDNNLFVCGSERAGFPDGITLIVDPGDPLQSFLLPFSYNEYVSCGDGRWAGARPDLIHLYQGHDKVRDIVGRAPLLAPGRFGYMADDNQRFVIGTGLNPADDRTVAQGPTMHAAITDRHHGWVFATGVHARDAFVDGQRVSMPGDDTEMAIWLFDDWVMTQPREFGYKIRRIGAQVGIPIRTGNAFNPDVKMINGKIVFVASTGAGESIRLEYDPSEAIEDLSVQAPPKPVCATVYTRGESGACGICGHPKPVHTLKEPDQPEDPKVIVIPNYSDHVARRAEEFGHAYTRDDFTDEQREDAAAQLTRVCAYDLFAGVAGAPKDPSVGLYKKANRHGHDEHRLLFDLSKAVNLPANAAKVGMVFAKIVIQTGASWASLGWAKEGKTETEPWDPVYGDWGNPSSSGWVEPRPVAGVHTGEPGNGDPDKPPPIDPSALEALRAEFTTKLDELRAQLRSETAGSAGSLERRIDQVRTELTQRIDSLPSTPGGSDVVRESTHVPITPLTFKSPLRGRLVPMTQTVAREESIHDPRHVEGYGDLLDALAEDLAKLANQNQPPKPK
jgi:hypothetical protein